MSWRPRYMRTRTTYAAEDPWTAWWGPFTVTSLVQAHTGFWITNFVRSYSFEFRIGRQHFVFLTWRERQKPAPAPRITIGYDLGKDDYTITYN